MKNQLVFLSLIVIITVLAALCGCATTQTPVPMVSIVSPQDGGAVAAGSVTVIAQVSNFTIVDKQGQASVAGEGHLHFYLDVGTVPSDPSKPAIPANAQVQWAHVAATSYTFTNVSPGTHTITVQLANNDHTPVIPLAYQTITVTVAAAPSGTQDMTSCTVGSDCVQEQCCHATSCINRAFKHVCTELCTNVCTGPLDCGAGHCSCINGKCGVAPGTTPAPTLAILSPQNGATVGPGIVPVTVRVSNFDVVDRQGQAGIPGQGHVHFYLDAGTLPSDPAKPAIPANAQVQWAHVSGTSYSFTNVSAGSHVIAVQLVNNDHTPLTPLVTASVTVTARAAPDLTNQNSPEAATFTAYPSRTALHTPAAQAGLRFVAGGFISPMMVVASPDSSGRLFLVDQTGVVKIFFANGTVLDEPFLDVRDRLVHLDPAYDERGLLSLAFHPQYTANGRVFAYYSAPLRAGVDPNWSCTNHLSEFRVSATDPNRVDMASEKVLLQVDKPYENHNGGTLLFGPEDGYLYLPLGDGGRADDTGMGHTPGTGNGQDLTKILGKVIRIDVDRTSPGKQYGIPPDNPFLSVPGALPEIYAYGFRNPAYATFDSGGSHGMFISMAGQRLFESVFMIYRGGDYPWNIREGTHCFNPANDFAPRAGPCPTVGAQGLPLIGPVVELGHDVGDVIVGGVLYRGTLVPELRGKFIYGTWSDENRLLGNGTLLVASPPAGVDLASLPSDASLLTATQNAMWATQEIQVMNNPNRRINAFILQLSEDRNHEILVLINQNGGPGLSPQGSGQVWQMVPASTPNLENTASRVPVTPVPTTAAPTGGAVSIQLTQQGDKFIPSTLSVPAGATLVLTLNDQDRDPHNFALYSSQTSSAALFRSPVVTGPVTLTYTFPGPSTPGTYYYRSDPNVGMVGTLVVTAPSSSMGGGGGY